ncbi:MAG: tetratricopeptide repeat protein [Gammaproteobacteria bacterium]
MRFVITLLTMLLLFGLIGSVADADTPSKSILVSVPGDHLNLGQVTFPTSTTSPEAQSHFVLGVKYLHNFMYPLALREFMLAQKADPNFALSYWGMAMCYKWSLWSYENKKKGERIIQEFNSIKDIKMSPLEKGLLNAIALTYGSGTLIENEKKYMKAMAQLYQQYPANPDVASFYALSMIGYAMDAPFSKDLDRITQKARDVLKPFLKSHPGHPGVIHYYMHANDIPNSHFPETALSVVPNVYKYLSDSSHVLHMPSHLYTDLGMWSDAAIANQYSIQAGHHMCAFLKTLSVDLCALDGKEFNRYNPLEEPKYKWTKRDDVACDADNIYHSTEWLQYEYLQTGQFKKAEKQLAIMRKVAETLNDPKYDFWLYRMQARQLLYADETPPVKELPKPLIEKSSDKIWAAYSECGLLLADGLSAIRNEQTLLLSPIDSRFDNIISQLTMPSGAAFKQACIMNQALLRGVKSVAIGKDRSAALKYFDRAYKIQTQLQSSHQSITLPYVPAQEIYGNFLLQDPHRKNLLKAVDLYENELTYNPNRSEAILGMARAQVKLGNIKLANDWYNKLLVQYKNADDIKAVSEANTFLKNHAKEAQ